MGLFFISVPPFPLHKESNDYALSTLFSDPNPGSPTISSDRIWSPMALSDIPCSIHALPPRRSPRFPFPLISPRILYCYAFPAPRFPSPLRLPLLSLWSVVFLSASPLSRLDRIEVNPPLPPFFGRDFPPVFPRAILVFRWPWVRAASLPFFLH